MSDASLWLSVLLLLPCVACERTTLESASGRYVTVHWDPTEQQLCGGTLAHMDASLEVVAGTYGVGLPEHPAIDVFWSTEDSLAESICGASASGCNISFPNGTNVVAVSTVADTHELTHSVRLGPGNGGLPSFFSEGFAERWDQGWNNRVSGLDHYFGALDYDRIVSQLNVEGIELDDFDEAAFFWGWLEAQYGAAKMAEFTKQLGPYISPDEIERAFEATFGLSLEQAVEATKGQPYTRFDVDACGMPHLPTYTWTGEELVLFEEETRACTDSDIVNTIGIGVMTPVRLIVPPAGGIHPTITITGDVSINVRFDRCLGAPRPWLEDEAPYFGQPPVSAPVLLFGGEYVVSLLSLVEPDGSVGFPEVRLIP